ncbi:MAG: type II secretion system minor pseudopilin GspI, partial [Steroidobacteraceae bacterium]|nr:type II secretion system minor pseudopilin GspI [Steroidobacteraceae bacterium]
VLEAIGGSADNVNYLRDRSFAQWIALNRIAEVRTAAGRAVPGVASGAVNYAGRDWQWQQTIEPLPGPMRLLRIEVRVRPQRIGASAPAAGDDSAWLVTLAGVLGPDLATARGDVPDWEPPAGTGAGNGSGAGSIALPFSQ